MLRAALAGSAILSAVLVLGAGPLSIAQETDDDAAATEEVAEDDVADRDIAVIPAPPENPVAAAAYHVLEVRCARCHQVGALTDESAGPLEDFGFILDLNQLAGDTTYVRPGNPDGSKIVQYILNEEMPYDFWKDGDLTKEPVSDTELVALREWITELGEAGKGDCDARKPVRLDDIVAAIATDLDTLDEDRIETTRYLTLTHLANTCMSEERMNVYRQGAVKALNSLSYSSDVVVLETIDDEKTIIRFNLRDLNWDEEDWDTLLAAYPYAALPDTNLARAIGDFTHTAMPFVRADWFAEEATSPPLYNILLDLPPTVQELEARLGVDVLHNIAVGEVDRAGFQVSGVSANNRMIERHEIPFGYFWTSYDFAGNRDRQSLFEYPLGPGDEHDEFAFSHDGGETIFSLPNGFQGYYLNNAKGEQLDQGPTAIVRDKDRRDLAVTNGISCIGCHFAGIRDDHNDEIRDYVTSNKSFPKEVRETVEEIYPTVDRMREIYRRDAARFEAAMREAGLDPKLSLNGVEMTTALGKVYDDDVSLELAAAEFDLSVEDFLEATRSSGDGEAIRLGKRLQQGMVPRDGYEAIFPRIIEYVSDLERPSTIPEYEDVGEPRPYDNTPYLVAGNGDDDDKGYEDEKKPVRPEDYKPTPQTYEDVEVQKPRIDLALFSDKPSYYKDDLAVFTVISDTACYLTLLNVDSKGVATVLFPNKYGSENLLRPGRQFDFPGPDAGFRFRLDDIGTETVIAICDTDAKVADYIELDANEVLTELGDYEAYLKRSLTKRSIEVEADPDNRKPEKSQTARAAIRFEIR